MNSSCFLGGRLLLQLLLLFIFLMFFGRQAIEKYLLRGVMVVESTLQEVAVDVCVVPLHLYKELSSDKDKLMESSITVGALILDR